MAETYTYFPLYEELRCRERIDGATIIELLCSRTGLESALAHSGLTRDDVLDVCRSAESTSAPGARLLAFTREFLARRGDELSRLTKIDETIFRCTPLAAELTALYPDPERKAKLAVSDAPLKLLVGRDIDDYGAVVLEALAAYADDERAGLLRAAAVSARTNPR
jgi:hypothetical protein